MKKVINGKKYDTETATFVCDRVLNDGDDLFKKDESLYHKRTGEFFLYGIGGAGSKYAMALDMNNFCEGEKIIPLSIDEAKQFIEENGTVEDYEKYFTIDKDGSKTFTCKLSQKAYDKLKAKSEELGFPMSSITEELIMKNL